MSPTTGPHVANDSVLDVTAGARSAAAVIRPTPARGSLASVHSAGTRGEDAALEEVARVREALRGNLGEPLCGHLTGQRWTGCTPESLRCWIIRCCRHRPAAADLVARVSDGYVSLT